jgi:hypothetical protein
MWHRQWLRHIHADFRLPNVALSQTPKSDYCYFF